MSDLMTVREAADYLKFNKMTIYRLAQQHKIPASKIGGAWRFSKSTLDDWLRTQSLVDSGVVLVVDDDALVREVIKDVVLSQGYKVVMAGTGEEALEKMKERQFGLIFLDLGLPGMSGVEVFRAVKERDKDAVVVVVTGYADTPIAIEALSMGPMILIRKPFKVDDVVNILDIVMKSKR
ncbi:MAG: response regulator [Dehalococcoidia bacterium]|nr:response regulator [Dehalococcoidia bacterium]